MTDVAGDNVAKARDFNLFDVPKDYVEQRHKWFKLLRDHDPVHRNADGTVLITRYNDVKQVWTDATAIVDKTPQFRMKFGEGPLFEHHTVAMLFRDPPDHERLRAVVNPFFSPASVARLRDSVFELSKKFLDEVEDKKEIDLVPDYAFRITITVICRMLGVPIEDGVRIQGYSKKILFPLNPKVSEEDIAAGNQAVIDFKNYLAPFLAEVRSRKTVDPSENIMTALVAAERGGATISELEVLHMCIQALNGGHESVTNLISMAVHVLLDEPEQLAWLREKSEEDMTTAIEELTRFISPIQLQGRRITRETEISGVKIPANTDVIFGVAASSRDERVFEDADSLILKRRLNPHLGFGVGTHACIGRPLARLHASIALPALLRRFKTIERTGEAKRAPSIRFHGLTSLPLRLKH